MESEKKNCLYPIEIDDYPKLFDFVLTPDGLKYFHDLKRRYVLGKEMVLDEYNKLRLLAIYYATSNRNEKEVLAWQDICVTLDNQGIFEKEMYKSKEDLKEKSFIVPNPLYVEGLYKRYVDYIRKNQDSK